MIAMAFTCVLAIQGQSYYLSSSTGNDANDGSRESPWSSLAKISSTALKAGDTVCFKRGDRFNGHFVIKGSGEMGNPIVIRAYGTGEKPLITGEVGEANGGDYQEAIYVENQDHISFDGIEVNNERIHNRVGVDSVDAYGIYIYNSGDRVLRNFTFRDMTFRNVYAVKEMNDPEDFNGLEVAAVRIESARNTIAGKEKNIRDVLMEDCYFENLQRLGVHMKHQGGNNGIGNDSLNRNMNLVFRHNEFHHTGGTCILPTNTYNVLIEHNLFDRPGARIDPRMPGRGSSVWTWRCRNTVIQYNQCLHIRGYLDSHGIHIDHENRNTFVQYNYMEDCEGGFVEILGGNVYAVYRFNISVNDGWRKNPNWINSNHTLWINEKGPGGKIEHSDSTYIYNNTIYIDSAFSTAIDINAKNTFIYNNIFYAMDGGSMGGQQVNVKSNGTPLFMTNNLYKGTVSPSFRNMDARAFLGDPNFVDGGGEGSQGYQLKHPSMALNIGTAVPGPILPGAGKGIFEHLPSHPNVDFFGNPVDLVEGTPNAGACNAKLEVGLMPERGEFSGVNGFALYPNPATSTLYISSFSNMNNRPEIRIFDMKGNLVQKFQEKGSFTGRIIKVVLDDQLPAGVYLLTVGDNFRKVFLKSLP